MLTERPRLEGVAQEHIDLSDIPEITLEQASRAVRGYRPVSKHQVTLWLDDEVLPWLLAESERSHRSVNQTLRREMQYQARKTRESADLATVVPYEKPLAKAS